MSVEYLVASAFGHVDVHFADTGMGMAMAIEHTNRAQSYQTEYNVWCFIL